jgi:hypothetical protein
MNSTVVLLALAAFTASDSTSFSILVSSPLLVRHPHSAPDLVDISETIVFDGAAARLRLGEDLPAAGVLTLHHLSGDRLSSYALRLTIGPGRLRKLAVKRAQRGQFLKVPRWSSVRPLLGTFSEVCC